MELRHTARPVLGPMAEGPAQDLAPPRSGDGPGALMGVRLGTKTPRERGWTDDKKCARRSPRQRDGPSNQGKWSPPCTRGDGPRRDATIWTARVAPGWTPTGRRGACQGAPVAPRVRGFCRAFRSPRASGDGPFVLTHSDWPARRPCEAGMDRRRPGRRPAKSEAHPARAGWTRRQPLPACGDGASRALRICARDAPARARG